MALSKSSHPEVGDQLDLIGPVDQTGRGHHEDEAVRSAQECGVGEYVGPDAGDQGRAMPCVQPRDDDLGGLALPGCGERDDAALDRRPQCRSGPCAAQGYGDVSRLDARAREGWPNGRPPADHGAGGQGRLRWACEAKPRTRRLRTLTRTAATASATSTAAHQHRSHREPDRPGKIPAGLGRPRLLRVVHVVWDVGCGGERLAERDGWPGCMGEQPGQLPGDPGPDRAQHDQRQDADDRVLRGAVEKRPTGDRGVPGLHQMAMRSFV